MKGMITHLFIPQLLFCKPKGQKWLYHFLHWAFEALAKWYLNGWRDQNFCEGQPFRFKNLFAIYCNNNYTIFLFISS